MSDGKGRQAARAAGAGARWSQRAVEAVATDGTSLIKDVALSPLVWKLVGAGLAMLVILFVLVVASVSSRPSGRSGSCSTSSKVPQQLAPIYQAASDRYELGPMGAAVLAGINKIETDFGRNTSNSSAGAQGWMQFMPATWARYGVDANGDGAKNSHNPDDAIFGTAHYLKALGAPKDWHKAIFGYNHAEWYVKQVWDAAQGFVGECTSGPTPSLPADSRLGLLDQWLNWVEAQRYPYCMGGGHVTPARASPPPLHQGYYCKDTRLIKHYDSREAGLDCSSAVSMMLQKIGYDVPTSTSGAFMHWGDPGPGRSVTIWANSVHVYMQIRYPNGVVKYWGTSDSNYRGGPGFHGERSGAGFTPRHPPGM